MQFIKPVKGKKRLIASLSLARADRFIHIISKLAFMFVLGPTPKASFPAHPECTTVSEPDL